jgi:hypothetical protein
LVRVVLVSASCRAALRVCSTKAAGGSPSPWQVVVVVRSLGGGLDEDCLFGFGADADIEMGVVLDCSLDL